MIAAFLVGLIFGTILGVVSEALSKEERPARKTKDVYLDLAGHILLGVFLGIISMGYRILQEILK